MEADSHISENKTIENKSILSLNYVYKKIILKESYESSISKLRTLNYEKIAKFKMKNMNFKFLLNSIFKLKNSIKRNNPLLKYIKNVQPYSYPYLKKNISQNILSINELFKNNIKSKFPKKEKILNFSASTKNFKIFYYSRMSNIEYKKVNLNKNEKIILIQKHIRGFLSKRIVDEEINKIIAKKIIHKILIIQKAIRSFLKKKNSLSHLIINIIENERISKSNKITDIFSLYHYRNFYKRQLLIQKIIKERNYSILLIQKKYRSYIFIKEVKKILAKENNSYVLTYPFNAKSVQIKIYTKTSYKIYDYFICPIRKYFILYLEKTEINEGEYACQMIINNNIVLDNRYKYVVDNNNNLYNLIYIGNRPKIEPPKQEINEINTNSNTNNINDKKNNNDKRHKKKKHRKVFDESDNDFFFYSYNDNSNSTNSYSTKSENEKNKLKSNIKKLKEKNDNILKNTNKNKINEFLKPNKKKEEKRKNSFKNLEFYNFMNTNTENKNKNKIFIKNIGNSPYFKKVMNKNINKLKNKSAYLSEQYDDKEDRSIQSQKIRYINILDELGQNISSTSRSNFSMKNLNSYTKKTHQTKFSSNHSTKPSSKKPNA